MLHIKICSCFCCVISDCDSRWWCIFPSKSWSWGQMNFKRSPVIQHIDKKIQHNSKVTNFTWWTSNKRLWAQHLNQSHQETNFFSFVWKNQTLHENWSWLGRGNLDPLHFCRAEFRGSLPEWKKKASESLTIEETHSMTLDSLAILLLSIKLKK